MLGVAKPVAAGRIRALDFGTGFTSVGEGGTTAGDRRPVTESMTAVLATGAAGR